MPRKHIESRGDLQAGQLIWALPGQDCLAQFGQDKVQTTGLNFAVQPVYFVFLDKEKVLNK